MMPNKNHLSHINEVIKSDNFTLTSKNNEIAKKMAKVSAQIMLKNKEAYKDLANR